MSCIVACSYDDMVEDFREAEEARECRYAVFDAEYVLKGGQKRGKLVFFLWYVIVHTLFSGYVEHLIY